MVLRLASAIGLALLAGCQTMSPEALAASDDQHCRSLGAYPGMQAYAECRLLLDRDHQAEAAEMSLRRKEFALAVIEGLRSIYGTP